MRDAKLEAMGLRADDHEFRRAPERAQMATDEIVSLKLHATTPAFDTFCARARLWSGSRRGCASDIEGHYVTGSGLCIIRVAYVTLQYCELRASSRLVFIWHVAGVVGFCNAFEERQRRCMTILRTGVGNSCQA